MAETPEPDWLLPLRALLGSGAGEGTDLLMFGAQVAEVERGRAVVRLPVTPATAGGAQGGVHGGVVATLVDMTLVTATMTMLRRGEAPRGTAELNVSFLRPAVGEELVATCDLLKKGRSLAVGDVEVRNNRDVLVAKGRGTYAVGPVG
jgi:acyl-CoA thioesterase